MAKKKEEYLERKGKKGVKNGKTHLEKQNDALNVSAIMRMHLLKNVFFIGTCCTKMRRVPIECPINQRKRSFWKQQFGQFRGFGLCGLCGQCGLCGCYIDLEETGWKMCCNFDDLGAFTEGFQYSLQRVR